jgi:hypothetical protein
MKLKELKIKKSNEIFVIQAGKELLKTPAGLLIESNTINLMERIIADFANQGDIIVEEGIIVEPRILSAYLLASTKRDFIDEGDNLSKDLPGWLSIDPIFAPTAGHPLIAMYQKESQAKAELFLQENGLVLKTWDRYNAKNKKNLIGVIQGVIDGFTPFQKSALINLSWPCGSHFVNSTVYLLGKYDEREWATAIFSRTPDVCRIIGESPINDFLSAKDDLADEEREDLIESIIKSYQEDCLIVRHYLEVTNSDL